MPPHVEGRRVAADELPARPSQHDRCSDGGLGIERDRRPGDVEGVSVERGVKVGSNRGAFRSGQFGRPRLHRFTIGEDAGQPFAEP